MNIIIYNYKLYAMNIYNYKLCNEYIQLPALCLGTSGADDSLIAALCTVIRLRMLFGQRCPDNGVSILYIICASTL